MRNIMATLVLVIAVVVVLLWAGQRRLIYFPFGKVPPPASVGLKYADEVSFTTDDGLTLHGWYVPAVSPPARFTVLAFSGNAGNRGMRAALAEELARRGVATFLFDYRGYGDNPGSPTETGLARDARAALAHLTARPDTDPQRVVYFGESLGAAVAVRLATEAPPLALVLRSPFTSLADIGRHHYPYLPVRLMLHDRYPSIDLVPLVRTPILVIAGDRDRVIPTEQSKRLHAAAPEPKELLIIDGADHNDDALFAGTQLIDGILRFVDGISAVSRNP
jgi:fermentation-respiration switch protein FrsA (DUF1100 family)